MIRIILQKSRSTCFSYKRIFKNTTVEVSVKEIAGHFF